MKSDHSLMYYSPYLINLTFFYQMFYFLSYFHSNLILTNSINNCHVFAQFGKSESLNLTNINFSYVFFMVVTQYYFKEENGRDSFNIFIRFLIQVINSQNEFFFYVLELFWHPFFYLLQTHNLLIHWTGLTFLPTIVNSFFFLHQFSVHFLVLMSKKYYLRGFIVQFHYLKTLFKIQGFFSNTIAILLIFLFQFLLYSIIPNPIIYYSIVVMNCTDYNLQIKFIKFYNYHLIKENNQFQKH